MFIIHINYNDMINLFYKFIQYMYNYNCKTFKIRAEKNRNIYIAENLFNRRKPNFSYLKVSATFCVLLNKCEILIVIIINL